MKYRIKQTSKHCFLVQGNLEALDVVMGHERWFPIDMDGEAFQPYRDKYYFESRVTYNFDLDRHNNLKATFISVESAKAFIKECKITYPKYHKA